MILIASNKNELKQKPQITGEEIKEKPSCRKSEIVKERRGAKQRYRGARQSYDSYQRKEAEDLAEAAQIIEVEEIPKGS